MQNGTQVNTVKDFTKGFLFLSKGVETTSIVEAFRSMGGRDLPLVMFCFLGDGCLTKRIIPFDIWELYCSRWIDEMIIKECELARTWGVSHVGDITNGYRKGDVLQTELACDRVLWRLDRIGVSLDELPKCVTLARAGVRGTSVSTKAVRVFDALGSDMSVSESYRMSNKILSIVDRF
jgi:hypothetical protein